MPLETLHPFETKLHHQLRDELNRQLTTADFLTILRVTPTGEREEFEDVETLASLTDRWLCGLDPDAVDPSSVPTLALRDRAAEVEIQAIPKKPSARGRRAAEVVGNPEPALAGWMP